MTEKTRPPIICTDDGWVLSACEPPVSIEELRDKMVASLNGTPAALWWSIGDHEVYQHETRIGERVDQVEPGGGGHVAGNVRHLIEAHGGPLTVLSQLCRDVGICFFPRVRMNSHYDLDPAAPEYGRFRRQHPELLIGRPGESFGKGSVEHGIRSGLDYVYPEVRSYRAGIICELFERFDVDGVELDFMRHPAFFRVAEAFQNRHLMTDLIRCVRERMAAARGRPIQLAVRVPPTLADCARIGLDVELWMLEGLVDIVVVGGGFIPYETPIREFVAVAAPRDLAVYGCIEATRHADEKNLRAIAAHFWRSGANGVYLYNFYTMSPEWNRRVLNQLADRESLQFLDKRYEADQTGRFTTPYHCAFPTGNIEAAFRYGSPAAQLPAILNSTVAGEGHVIEIEIADDLAAAAGALQSAVMTLRLECLEPDARLQVVLNDERLDWSLARVSCSWVRQEVEARFWERYPCEVVEVERSGDSAQFDLRLGLLRLGVNRLKVGLDGDAAVVLVGVELLLNYDGGE